MISLQKDYSAINAALTKLFDESGVRRTFTVPYVHKQPMEEHIKAVGAAAQQAGGLVHNFISTSHHEGGRGWNSGDGHTVGHPADKLRSTIIPHNDKNAKAAIDATAKYLRDIEHLIGETPEVKVAKGQLALVQKTDAAGMTLQDFGVMLIQLTHRPTQAAARAHDGTKTGGSHPTLRGPQGQPPQASEGDNAAPAGGGEQEQPNAAPVAPAAAPAAPAAAPETPGQ